MATLDSVMTKLRNLLASLNTKTGRSDATYNAAINALPNKKTSDNVTVNGATVTTPSGIYFSPVEKTVSNGAYSSSVSLTPGDGSVSVTGTNISLALTPGEPSSGYYITARGSGSVNATGIATVGTAGYIAAGSKSSDVSSKSSNTAISYYTVSTQERTVIPSTSEQTVTPISGKLLSKVTVRAIGTAEQATPEISVSISGKIKATATQSAGYVEAGEKSAEKQLNTQLGATITPTTSDIEAVPRNTYTLGPIAVKGDANLLPENIKSGVSIFGVDGTYEGSGGSTSGGIGEDPNGLPIRTVLLADNDGLTHTITYMGYEGGQLKEMTARLLWGETITIEAVMGTKMKFLSSSSYFDINMVYEDVDTGYMVGQNATFLSHFAGYEEDTLENIYYTFVPYEDAFFNSNMEVNFYT